METLDKMNTYKMSLVVATRNRREDILELIKCLEKRYEIPEWEMIVVDNGSTDGTTAAIEGLRTNLKIQLVYEKRQGKSIALNAGIKKAVGEIIVFSDDDVLPEKNWMRAYYHAAKNNPDKIIFGGKVNVNNRLLPDWIRNSFNLKEILVSEHDLGDEAITYPPNRYPIGPNMAVRKQAIEGLENPWPEDLGPGTSMPVGDEKGFLRKRSGPCSNNRLYVPDSVVIHVPKGEGLSLINSLKRCYWGGLAAGKMDRESTASCRRKDKVGTTILKRIRTVRSLKELLCGTIRSIGVIKGRIAL